MICCIEGEAQPPLMFTFEYFPIREETVRQCTDDKPTKISAAITTTKMTCKGDIPGLTLRVLSAIHCPSNLRAENAMGQLSVF